MRHLILIWFDAFYCDKKALNEFSSGLAYCMWMFRGGLVLYFLFFWGHGLLSNRFIFSSLGHAVRYLLFVFDPWCGEKKV